MKPARAVRARTAAAKASAASTSGRSTEGFHKGVTALAQYLALEGGALPGRSHVEHLPDGPHRTGVWIANQKQRRDRLDAAQLAVLAALGVEWAGS
ncbi:hypothetical protein [Streptomyces sp. NPDC002209]|uniref:hypothetical protein n=1 Tax=Streptomyces sp. NPDC002209 TaxID=3364638 RepID=UPI003698110D